MATPRKPVARKPAAKSAPKRAGGRPRIPFDGTDKDKVRLLARAGTKQAIIAGLLGCSVDTLQRRFADELGETPEMAHALVSASLLDKALGGDLGAMVWYEKTRRGFRETSRHEHTGADGKPIELRDLSGLSDAELDTLDAAARLLAGPSVAGAGQ